MASVAPAGSVAIDMIGVESSVKISFTRSVSEPVVVKTATMPKLMIASPDADEGRLDIWLESGFERVSRY
ncbi:Uncharacterised protein [Chlamydia trachomatis]|nr:Uncharacterised protein [Chlamydia trachomatis]